jgi:UDP-N-acetylglucosamine--N-acetylmuramyl-(pentapeptide) pyrophosphoryl-undecaprenol N-acetylglucosamine transferase
MEAKRTENIDKTRVLIMAGGTGGHVFPALAIAKCLQKEDIQVEWLGTQRGLEATIVPAAGIPLHCISVTSWRREGFVKRLLGPFLLLAALYQSLQILRHFKPQLVLGMGGFASGPGGIAAWFLGIPLVVHEQNAVAGVTNRILARFASRVLEGFPEGFPKQVKAIWTGNPVREELSQVSSPESRFKGRTGALRLLIIGGSQGATALNKLCPTAIAEIPEAERPEIWHQAGGGNDQVTINLYQTAGVKARVDGFIQEMDKAYAWADIVICRAGALTVAELATVGVGSILVPFPFAVDDHQTHNGRFLEAAGAAILVQQKALDPTKLAEIMIGLHGDRQRLLKMAEAAKSVAKPKATQQVLEHCKEIMKLK